ncbi:hypothetical protein [Rhodothermus profundi]|nr:hypothetical protein [Rhodothermus profundi]
MPSRLSDIHAVPKDDGFSFDVPGCYRTAAFQELLARYPTALQLYARHVEARSYSKDYLQHVRQVVPRLVRWLGAELAADGRPGLCVQASALLSRLLEDLGIWNYVVAGGCVLSFVPANVRPRVFYLFDLQPLEVPHAWVVAPPFQVIDLTLRQQRYPGAEAKRIPRQVMSCRALQTSVVPEDVCTPALLKGLLLRGWRREQLLPNVFVQFWHFLKHFPARQVEMPGVTVKYIPARLLLPPWHAAWEAMPLINGKSFQQFRSKMAIVLARSRPA